MRRSGEMPTNAFDFSPIRHPPRDVEIRRGGRPTGLRRCSRRWMNLRACGWLVPEQSIVAIRLFAGSGFVTQTCRLARFVGCVCPDMQNRADGHRRREHQPAFGTRCISWHAQTVETATETAKCCGIKRVVYVRAYTTRRIICVAAVPCLLSRILCAAAWAT